MTPRLSGLFDVEEDHNIGVQVADGDVIKCNKIGKIQIEMIEDNGDSLFAALRGCIYIPGLSQRLFHHPFCLSWAQHHDPAEFCRPFIWFHPTTHYHTDST
jgi:hypothetical protein